MKISSAFAPPLKIIAPFFVVGIIFYTLSVIALFGFNSRIEPLDMRFIGVAHLFLVGFVIMIIFGSMAQLVPVIIEKGHCCVGFYPLIFAFTTLGAMLLALGFLSWSALLPYAGLTVGFGILIFAVDLLLTMYKAPNRSLSVMTMHYAVGFLIIGVFVGFLMTLVIERGVDLDITYLLKSHISLLLGGFVSLVFFGVTHILLPMFGLAHGFDERPGLISFWLMVFGVSTQLLLSPFGGGMVGFYIALLSALFHIRQVFLIYKKRVRKEVDIWLRSLFTAYGLLVLAVLLCAVGLFFDKERLLFVSGWFFVVGFLGFLITGHLYKIIPFLVWFERFSPLVGKQKIPMLHQMVPKKSADFQWGFTILGVLMTTIGLISGSDAAWYSGISFLAAGAVYLANGVIWMLKFR